MTNNGLWKLIDFGLAEAMDIHGEMQRKTSIGGTVEYMAPEVFEKNAKLRKVSVEGVDIPAFVPFLLTSRWLCDDRNLTTGQWASFSLR